jgi:hypothetical protein
MTLGLRLFETAVIRDIVAAWLASGRPLVKLRLDPSLFSEVTEKLIASGKFLAYLAQLNVLRIPD